MADQDQGKLFDNPTNEFEQIANDAWEGGREAREARERKQVAEDQARIEAARERLRGQQLQLGEDAPEPPEPPEPPVYVTTTVTVTIPDETAEVQRHVRHQRHVHRLRHGRQVEHHRE